MLHKMFLKGKKETTIDGRRAVLYNFRVVPMQQPPMLEEKKPEKAPSPVRIDMMER